MSAIGESRWPPVLAVLLFMVAHITVHLWLPGTTQVVRMPWLVPVLEAILVVALVTVNPSSGIEARRRHRVALVIVSLLALSALYGTGVLTKDLIEGTGVANEAGPLLAAAVVVWLGNNLSFGLLYWLMDAGGPLARGQGRAGPPDFAFTQQLSPEVMPPGWRPVFMDYLHLGFTNATAFSPTDVMPLTHRAKYTMLVQATVALALFTLVVARSVNAFT
ncbi:MAG TPA: hypothetical protein PKD59_06685 [Miltoncostaeaceae bacterium]|nr:hypothetical protein [Miltoncostaeaceae bacterium]